MEYLCSPPDIRNASQQCNILTKTIPFIGNNSYEMAILVEVNGKPHACTCKHSRKWTGKRAKPELHYKQSSISTSPLQLQLKCKQKSLLLGLSLFGQRALNGDFHSVTIIENCNRITFAVTRISAWWMYMYSFWYCVWVAAMRRLLTHLPICVCAQTLWCTPFYF